MKWLRVFPKICPFVTFFLWKTSLKLNLYETDTWIWRSWCDKLRKLQQSTGYGRHNYQIMKAAKHILCPLYLSKMINCCMDNGNHFDERKIAKVTPLHKGGLTSEMRNYHPISILPSFNKIFKTIIKPTSKIFEVNTLCSNSIWIQRKLFHCLTYYTIMWVYSRWAR